MEESVCPKCGRKWKAFPMEEGTILMIPQDKEVIKDCPECGRFGKKE